MEIKEKKELFLNLDNLLEILGNSTRRVILSKLAKVPHSASELAHSLGISRQAVHSQLKILADNGLLENIEPDTRGGKFRIKSNISVRIDITPDYYNINYKLSRTDESKELIQLKDIGCQIDYDKINLPNKKLRFLGEKLKDIEETIRKLENDRSELIQNKECLIVELKNIMRDQYEQKLEQEQPNLEKEIFYTLFYNPMKYFKRISIDKRINIDKLLDDMFFSDMGKMRRDQHRVSIKYMLKDLSKLMDVFREDEDNWFFDI